MTAPFLSDAWVADLPRTAADALRGGPDACIQHVIDDGDRTVHYWLRLHHGTVTSGTGDADAPDVVVTCDAATARALHDGAVNAQEAFRAGRLRLRGDVATLVRLYEAIAGVA